MLPATLSRPYFNAVIDFGLFFFLLKGEKCLHYDADGKHCSKHFAVERDMVQYFGLHRNSIGSVNF